MSIEVNVLLPEPVYDQFQSLAQQRQQGIAEAIAEYLIQNPPGGLTDTQLTSPIEANLAEAVTREKQAFLHLHQQLWEEYPGQHVAIYNGTVVDHDTNKLALYARIEERYPTHFVLIRRVEQQPERTLHFRSPHYIER